MGLTTITVGIETPNDETLNHYKRKPIHEDCQQQFIATCRELGIRTAAGFMIGFPEDTASSILRVLSYAKSLNPRLCTVRLAKTF